MNEMEQEISDQGTNEYREFRCRMRDRICPSGSGGAFYFLGFIGALVYYLTSATSVLGGVIGFFKALFWPAFLIYGSLKFLGM